MEDNLEWKKPKIVTEEDLEILKWKLNNSAITDQIFLKSQT